MRPNFFGRAPKRLGAFGARSRTESTSFSCSTSAETFITYPLSLNKQLSKGAACEARHADRLVPASPAAYGTHDSSFAAGLHQLVILLGSEHTVCGTLHLLGAQLALTVSTRRWREAWLWSNKPLHLASCSDEQVQRNGTDGPYLRGRSTPPRATS